MTRRRISQTISLLLLHSSWGPELKWLCTPVLSCHSCALAWFACPIGVFIHYSGYQVFPFLAVGTVMLLGVLFGRLLCGWVCPFGFLQDMLNKIPTPKLHLPPWTSKIKYVVLVSMVFAIPYWLGEQTMYSFCRICPASAIQVTIPNLIAGQTSAIGVAMVVKLSVLFTVLVLAVLCSRSFCRLFCPIGAMLAPLNHITFWTVKAPKGDCMFCKKCDTVCAVGGEPSVRIANGVPPNRAADCVVCHECRHACPEPANDQAQ
jgi:ferredoxin-type protein NapH